MANKKTLLHKTKAFTLFEVLIAMTISGIVISIVSILFLNITKLYHREKNIADMSNEILELFSAIHADMLHAEKMVETSFGFKILKNDDEIIYEIYGGSITRKYKTINRKFQFETEDYHVEYLNQRNNLLKSVFFNIYITDYLIYPVFINISESKKILFEKEISNAIY